jgi:hypothetical protein
MGNGIDGLLRLGTQAKPRKPRVRPDLFGPAPEPETIERILDCIFNQLREDLRGITHHNPVVVARGLGTLRSTLRTLVVRGHNDELYAPILADLEVKMNGLAIAARGRLLKTFLSPASSAEQIEQALQGLVELIDGGYWPSWQRDFNAALDECRTR